MFWIKFDWFCLQKRGNDLVCTNSIFSLFSAKVTAYPYDEKYTTFRNIRKHQSSSPQLDAPRDLAREDATERITKWSPIIWGISFMFSTFDLFLAKGINKEQEGRFIPPKSAIKERMSLLYICNTDSEISKVGVTSSTWLC